MRILAALVVVLLTLPAVAGEDVTFTTADGLKITGTLYPSGRKGAAGVVALPMYMRQRSSWEPVAAHFTKAGIDFLAIDMRGHGDSAVQDGEDLSRRAKGRDPKLFNAMWQDALAAREFLIGKGADENRIGLLGASVGCSVAIDAASRTEKIPGVCVMTPGKAYLGVNTMEDLPGYGKRPMLILSSKEEAGGGATAIQEKLGDAAELVLYDERQVHGTLMFGKVAGVEEKIVSWFDDLLGGAVAVDGKTDEREAPGSTLWTWRKGRQKIVFSAELRGRWWHVIGVPADGVDAPTELEVAWRSNSDKKSGWSVRFNGDDGTWSRQVCRKGKWSPVRVKAAPGPGPSAARGDVIEMLLPVGRSFTAGPELRLRVTAKVGGKDVKSKWEKLGK